MKIVILDSETVSRNDVSLEGITALGESIVYGLHQMNRSQKR